MQCIPHHNICLLWPRRVIKIITFSEFIAHTAPLLEKLGILNIYQIVEYFVGIFVFISLHEIMAGSLSLGFCNEISIPETHLRSTCHKKKISQQSIRIAGHRMWNNFPILCKSSISLHSFKTLLNKYLQNLI